MLRCKGLIKHTCIPRKITKQYEQIIFIQDMSQVSKGDTNSNDGTTN